MTKTVFKFALAAAAMTQVPTAASAAIITRSFTFTASRFIEPDTHVTAPISIVTGAFSLHFDNSVNYMNSVNGINFSSFSFPVESAIGFDFRMPDSFFNFESGTIGGIQNGVGDIQEGKNDFFLFFADITQNPKLLKFEYTSNQAAGAFVAQQLEYSVSSPTPEPASWALMITGFGLSGSAIRRRRQIVRFAAA